MKRLPMCVVYGVVCVLFLMSVSVATATELVWTFINPSFGGSPFNGAWLLDQAQAQNKFSDNPGNPGNPGNPSSLLERDSLEDFENSLNRQVLYKLSRKIVDSAFGEEALEPGHYSVGDYIIDVSTDINGISVVITDISTGSTTTVQIPYY